jgi:hypothetical protein
LRLAARRLGDIAEQVKELVARVRVIWFSARRVTIW